MWNWIDTVSAAQQRGTPFALVTVIETKGSSPRELGAKMIVHPDGRFDGTIGGGGLEHQALADAKTCLAERTTKRFRYLLCRATGQCCGGVVELLIEVMNVGPMAYIFGAGHVGQALARTLVGTAFAVHLIDERSEWVQSPQVPTTVARHQIPWEDFLPSATWDDVRTHVIVMTMDHERDQAIIEAVAQRPAHYIGLIGSRNKWLEFQLRLRAKGMTPEQLGRVHCPIGLEVWGKAPQEVAISAAAELLQLHAHVARQGCHIPVITEKNVVAS